MSGPHDHPMGMLPLDQFDPNYAMYDNQHAALQRTSVPPTPYEGFGFWYRPNPQEAIYNPDPVLFDQTRSMQAPTMDVQLSLKHKRTRSGCFTCRHRRVKCDETKPICERCRKGGRTCEFPSKSSAPKKTKGGDPTTPTTERAPAENEALPTTIKEESEDDMSEADEDETSPTALQAASSPRQPDAQSNYTEDSGDKSRNLRKGSTTYDAPAVAPPWKDLKPELQMYLQFQRDHMTHYHYCFKLDPEDFIHKEFIDMALKFKPLLYAVVAFAAYHHTVRLPDDQADFNCFWKYYCKSIIKLRKFLESSRERNDLVLLTVLQLATFEEFMGDWNSLVSHHKAAFGILMSKYTPQTVMETDRGRKIFDWFIRLDVITGLMAVRDAALDRSWILYACDWHERMSQSTGSGYLQRKSEFFSKAVELVAHDSAHLFARANEAHTAVEEGKAAGVPIDDIMSEANKLSERLDEIRKQIQQLHDPSFAGEDAQATRSNQGSPFNLNVPLFRGASWSLNFVWIDWYGVTILLKNSVLGTLQKTLRATNPFAQPPPGMEHLQQQALAILPDLMRYSKDQCDILSALNTSTTSPAGVSLVCCASLALSTVFLPRAPPDDNSKYTLWARQQLADTECQGYIWPPHFRKEMATLWEDPEIEEWWLPKGEGKPRILAEIRAVVVDRTKIAQEKEKPGDSGRDLREIKGLFETLDIGRRGSIDALSNSARLDASYIASPAGIINAASMVSSPSSSTGSTSGFTSPRGSVSDAHISKPKSASSKVRGSVSGSATESPVTQSKLALSESQTSEFWDEQRR